MQQILKVPPRVCESLCRILVVDRDAMSGHMLAGVLTKSPKYEAETVTPASLLQAAAARCAQLAVISADLPSGVGASGAGKGLDLARAFSRAHPDVPLVILLDQPKRDFVISAFRCGARGVFTRDHGVDVFLDCVEHVRKGGIWTGRAETAYLLEALKSIPAPAASYCGDAGLLTRRESQVVSCAAQGKTNRIIANELRLSEHTVKNYLFRAFEKLGVSSRVELLFYLTTQGVDPQRKPPRSLEPESLSSAI